MLYRQIKTMWLSLSHSDGLWAFYYKFGQLVWIWQVILHKSIPFASSAAPNRDYFFFKNTKPLCHSVSHLPALCPVTPLPPLPTLFFYLLTSAGFSSPTITIFMSAQSRSGRKTHQAIVQSSRYLCPAGSKRYQQANFPTISSLWPQWCSSVYGKIRDSPLDYGFALHQSTVPTSSTAHCFFLNFQRSA